MKTLHSLSSLGFTIITIGATLLSAHPTLSQSTPTRFYCGTDENGDPATIVESHVHGNVPIITWNSGYFAQSANSEGVTYNDQNRCQIVSERLQKYSDQGTLNFFTSGRVNGMPVICVVADMDAPCNNESMLFTLKEGSDPEATVQKLFDIRAQASSERLYETNNQRTYVNFQEFLNLKSGQSSETTPEETEGIPLF